VDLDFGSALLRAIESIPKGRAATCGTVARALGDVRAAKAVAAWLTDHPSTPGVHRVVTADGTPVLRGAPKLLRKENARIADGRLHLEDLVTSLASVGFLDALREKQRSSAAFVSDRDEFDRPHVIGGVDAAYDRRTAYVAAVSCNLPGLSTIDIVESTVDASFPYIPTYLGFREGPGLEAIAHRLHPRPDVLLVDGHGQLHPARFGVACSVGLDLNLPTIGIAKHPLVGRALPERRTRSDATPIELEGRILGFAWTPPGSARPLYISVGHRISLDTALDIVIRTTRGTSPDPIRRADRAAKKRKETEKLKRGSTSTSAKPRTR